MIPTHCINGALYFVPHSERAFNGAHVEDIATSHLHVPHSKLHILGTKELNEHMYVKCENND